VGWNIGYSWMVCYAESEDGFNWTKPNLCLVSYLDEPPTNFVYGRQLSPTGFLVAVFSKTVGLLN
jgi:hypothetical protein